MTTTDAQGATDTPLGYAGASTRRVAADNAIEYAYRDTGDSAVPLVLLQHFRGNLDNWDPALIDALGAPETSPQGYLEVFFAPTNTSREAGQQTAGRIFGRTTDRDKPTTWQTRQAQYDAVCAWGIPNHSLLQRVAAIDLPVFVANGDSDPMILPRYSYLLAGLLPDARVTIYPDSAHGFLFQHHSQFAADVPSFLQAATADETP